MTEEDKETEDEDNDDEQNSDNESILPANAKENRRKYKLDQKPGDMLQCPKCPTLCKSKNQLAGHFSQNHTGLKLVDFKDQINIVPKKDVKSKSTTKPQVAQKMTDNENEENLPELGDAARVRGRIKQLLLEYAVLPAEKRKELLGEREVLASFLQALVVKDAPYSLIKGIDTDIETKIEPLLREAAGTKPAESPDAPGALPKEMDTELKMKIQKLRSNIKADLQKIANMPANLQDTISAEKDLLITLNRKLCKEDLVKKDVIEIEGSYSSFQPYIDAATKKASKSSGDNSIDEDDEDEEDDIEEAKQMKRLKRQARKLELKAEIRDMRAQMGLGTGVPTPATPQPIMVPRPKIDPTTKQQMVDENGVPITEMTYQYPLSQDPIQQLMMQFMLEELKSKRGGDGSSNTDKILLEMKRDELEWKKEFMEMQYKHKDTGQSDEIKELRKETQQLLLQGHQNQVDQLSAQLEQTTNMLQRNPLDTLLAEKQKLMALGIVQDPATARALSSQEQSLQYSKEALDKTTAKLDGARDDLKELAGPLIGLQTEVMKRRMEQEDADARARGQTPSQGRQQPPKMSEEEKNRKWKGILNAVDEAAIQENQGG